MSEEDPVTRFRAKLAASKLSRFGPSAENGPLLVTACLGVRPTARRSRRDLALHEAFGVL